MPSYHFTDFDAFASTVRDANFEMLIQNPKRRSWSLSHIDLPGVHIQVGREGSGNITEGRSRLDGYLFFLPLSHAEAHSANGVALDDASIAILGPGSDFCLTSRIEHDWCSIFVPAHHLDPFRDPEEASSKSEKPTVRVTRSRRELANRCRTALREIMGTADRHPELESSPAALVASAELVKLGQSILGCVPVRENARRGRPKVARDEIIRRSQALLEERSGVYVSVSELAMAAGVSERTLRTAFEETFGVGPTHYLRLRNLHRIHRALRAAEPGETSVAKVFLKHYEWELGRVAGRYRRLFGELPSETLRAERR